MKKTATIISLISGGILLVLGLVIGYELWLKRKLGRESAPGSAPPPAPWPSFDSTTQRTGSLDCDMELYRGVKGPEVQRLQQFLNTLIVPPMAPLIDDGDFGPKTEGALLETLGLRQVSLNAINLPIGEHFSICKP